jgi:actin-related protein 2
MVGDEAAPVRSMLELSHPIDNGIVKDWEGMTHLWNYGIRKKVNSISFSQITLLNFHIVES